MFKKTSIDSFSIGILISLFALNANACNYPIATVVSAQGQVHVQAYGSQHWQEAHKDDILCPGDMLRTAKLSRATIVRPSGSGFTLDQNTTLTFIKSDKNNTVSKSWYLKLWQGLMFIRGRSPEQFDIQTPFINAVHKGTEFLVAVNDSRAEITVYDGLVAGENNLGKIDIKPGQKGTATATRAPSVQAITIRPEDAVQWALYYPPVIAVNSYLPPPSVYSEPVLGQADKSPPVHSEPVPQAHPSVVERPEPKLQSQPEKAEYNNNENSTVTPAITALQPAMTAYNQGDLTKALTALDSIAPAHPTPAYLTLKAGLLLTVGRVDQAQPLISQAQQQQPNNPDALALQAIIHITKNRQQQAYDLANKAVNSNPNAATAFIALSYAQQSLFKLDDAIKSSQRATQLNPNNALAWARLSELQLSQGDHKAALDAAHKAQQLNPKLSRTQTILGFAGLANTDIAQAKRQFQQALTLDSTDPLARLGLGLAKIRQGDVEDGKNELETAANLDPNNAVIRSYLGKAYYELRNQDYATTEYSIAKQLDPRDPTPYFYDAILKQTTNRPIEALHDMQKAIELNDNRGVYRSKLLLDSDIAARGAALGRIYNELGFSQRGLVEGWRGVTNDPTDYTSHRLLSDNYAALPGHDLARSSELLQSQLLQPINITPVQPRLAESQLFLLGGLGPSALSLNEFNPLFERNQFSLLTSGLVGSNETYSDEIVHSGHWDDFAYSLGQFHYQTNGFRKNNDIDTNIYNAFAQARITPDFNIQAEYRRREIDRGNLLSSFATPSIGLQSAIDNDRRRTVSDNYRFGTHFTPNKNSDLLGSFIYIDQDGENYSKIDGSSGVVPSRALIGETQYIQRLDKVKTILGGGYYHLNTKGSTTQNGNGYLYTHVRYPASVDWTLGLSFNLLSDTEFQKNLQSVNPKFGLQWHITPNTLIRAAGFRNVNTTARLPYQTLEPVQIAGFNQFFDDLYRTEALRMGVGIDHKVNSTLSTGVEVSRRYLDVHILGVKGEVEDRWREANYRAYLLWAPHPRWSSTLEYFFEKFDNVGTTGPIDTESQVIPVGISYFDPTGIFVKFKSSFFHQNVYLEDGNQNNDKVFLDLSLGYRLPKRHGIVEVQFQNLLNQNYRYQGLVNRQPVDTSGVPQYLPFPPEFAVFARFTLAL